MKYLFFCFFVVVVSASGFAQTKPSNIKKIGDGVYLLYYDTTAQKKIITKSTIVEFDTYIALLDVPISNDGAGTSHLQDYSEGGENVLQTLRAAFPTKPLRYVYSSHWHPHSLSSIRPFLTQGIRVITTENNFRRLSEMVDSTLLRECSRFVQFVQSDSLVIRDNANSIIAYKVAKEQYPSLPTEDFLYFYLPQYNYLHCSCMFQRLLGHAVKGKEMVSSRVEDLNQFLTAKDIAPTRCIGTDTYWDGDDGMVSGDTLRQMMQHGIGMSVLENEIRGIANETLLLQSDSIVQAFIRDAVPTSILNRAVYTSLVKKELHKAVAIARIQALLSPASANSWDTLGEAYYFLGEKELARHYQRQLTRMDKVPKGGGEKAWAKNLEDIQKKWRAEGL